MILLWGRFILVAFYYVKERHVVLYASYSPYVQNRMCRFTHLYRHEQNEGQSYRLFLVFLLYFYYFLSGRSVSALLGQTSFLFLQISYFLFGWSFAVCGQRGVLLYRQKNGNRGSQAAELSARQKCNLKNKNSLMQKSISESP